MEGRPSVFGWFAHACRFHHRKIAINERVSVPTGAGVHRSRFPSRVSVHNRVAMHQCRRSSLARFEVLSEAECEEGHEEGEYGAAMNELTSSSGRDCGDRALECSATGMILGRRALRKRPISRRKAEVGLPTHVTGNLRRRAVTEAE